MYCDMLLPGARANAVFTRSPPNALHSRQRSVRRTISRSRKILKFLNDNLNWTLFDVLGTMKVEEVNVNRLRCGSGDLGAEHMRTDDACSWPRGCAESGLER